MNEIIVDSFAGGGGTSEGIRQAVGRDPEIAINHDAMALAMHRANHPGTHHMVEDVWSIDARSMCQGRPIGLLWLSPDCKHFSKAKGGKPRAKEIRGLAWVGLQWVKSLPKRQRPRIIILENVEEFRDWGPLLDDGTPCPVQKGATFASFIGAFKALGYAAEWRELKACDYGDPTIRKRLFVIMRRDGQPIVWPARSHGNPKQAADAVMIEAGVLQPWRTAAEIIDWTLPCPSIFDTAAQIKAKFGVRAIRPLADNTLRRVAKGTMRYVVNSPKPFITKFNRGATGHDIDEPLATVTSHASETHGGGAAPLGLVAPVLVGCGGRAGQSEPRPGDEPVLTQTSKPDACIAAIHLSTMRNSAKPFSSPDEPTQTMTAGGANAAVVAAFLAQHNTGLVGHEISEPVSTIIGKGCTQNLVADHMVNLRGSDRRDAPVDEPLNTISAQGTHAACVAAFLQKYYGNEHDGIDVTDPMHPVTTKDRVGVVTVTLAGEPYILTDIGMRMLTPRERFSAQGFRPDYIIDYGLREDGARVNFTLEQQGRMCGNSVCPGLSRALVSANYQPASIDDWAEPLALPLIAAE